MCCPPSHGVRNHRPSPLVCQLLRFAALILIATTACSAISSQSYAASADSHSAPNVLLILADDMGFSDAGCYGSEIETPNLDRLAAGGLRFTQFYNTARCWPTRCSLMTGYYAQQIHMDPPKGKLPPWARLMPHYLKPLGYRCYHSGKWHVVGAPRPMADGGFDHSYLIEDHNRYFAPQKHQEDDRPLPPIAPGTDFYLTSFIADHAIKCLKQHAAKHTAQPFFQYLAFTSPHFPIQARADDIARYRDRYRKGWDAIRQERYERQRKMGIVDCALSPRDPFTVPDWNLSAEELRKRIGPGEAARAVAWRDLSDEQKDFQAAKMAVHAAMIDRMDRDIGRVLQQVRAMGAAENTLVLFASDNGASAEQIIRGDGHDSAAAPGSAKTFLCLGPGWSTVANTPLRLHKSWVHEGGISTPLIAYWPKGIAAHGELRHAPGHVIDLLPTLLELTGARPTPTWNGVAAPPLPGHSLVPALAGDVPIPREYLFFSHIENHALRMGDWKIAATHVDPSAWQLYDLSKDRSETTDLAARQPDRVRQMAARWQQLDTEFHRQSGVDLLPKEKPRKRGAKPRAK
jgi:arylsulfatase